MSPATRFNKMTTPSPASETSWTIGRLLNWTTDYFDRHGLDEPRLASEILLAFAAGLKRIELYTQFEQPMDAERTARFRDLVKRAAAHEPISYLVGEKEFYSLKFHVTPDVLIPRAESELLVECVIDFLHARPIASPRIWDIGTGSGCLAIAVLKNVAHATALGTDTSQTALDIAARNAERHGVAERLKLVCGDRFDVPSDEIPSGGFNVILSNPPYIPIEDMAGLDRNVRDYEPSAALTDGGDGLSFYHLFGERAAGRLTDDGVLTVEVADGRSEAARAAVESGGQLILRGGWKDRVVGAERVLMFEATKKAR